MTTICDSIENLREAQVIVINNSSLDAEAKAKLSGLITDVMAELSTGECSCGDCGIIIRESCIASISLLWQVQI
jgi:hypothetical protein